MSLAQLLGDDPRPPWQVLLDALQTADALQTEYRVRIRQGDTLTPELLDRLLEATDRAAKLSKMTLDANIGERKTRLLEMEGELVAEGVQAGLDALFTTLVEQYNLDPVQEHALRQVALQAAQAKLDGTAAQPSSDRPDKLSGSKLSRTVHDVRRLQAGQHPLAKGPRRNQHQPATQPEPGTQELPSPLPDTLPDPLPQPQPGQPASPFEPGQPLPADVIQLRPSLPPDPSLPPVPPRSPLDEDT
jgi:hypothetical protein